MRLALSVTIGLALLCSVESAAQSTTPLDHDAYEIWNIIKERVIAPDGSALAISYGPQNQDAVLDIHLLDKSTKYSIPRGVSPAFTASGSFAAFLVKPGRETTRAAKLDGKKKDELPKDSLGILALSSGEKIMLPNIRSFKMPEDSGDYIAYLYESVGNPDSSSTDSLSSVAADSSISAKKTDKGVGKKLSLRNLDSGEQRDFDFVSEYEFSKDGESLFVITDTGDSTGNSVFRIDTQTWDATTLLSGDQKYHKLAVAESGTSAAFLTGSNDKKNDDQPIALYHWDSASDSASAIASDSSLGLPAGWVVSANMAPSFSDSGDRLFFGTAPAPVPEDTTVKVLDEEEVVVDVWHWQDSKIQPMQTVQKDAELKRAYRAVVFPNSNRTDVVQLATVDAPAVRIGQKGDATLGIANSNKAYEAELSWDFPSYNDVLLVDINTGEKIKVLEKIQATASLSAGGNYVTYWDRAALTWRAYVVSSGAVVDLGAGIESALQDEIHDRPFLPNPYGNAGWTVDDDAFLIYDKYDIWAVDPRHPESPVCITNKFGRDSDLRFRYVRLDPEEEFVGKKQRLLLSAFDVQSKAGGFYEDQVDGSDAPKELAFSDHRYSRPVQAKNSDRLALTRESFLEFPDVWIARSDLSKLRKVTDLNPQQREYSWGSAELVHWTSTDGKPLDGLLYKPDGFDETSHYPLMVYFYEKNSDLLHRHHAPEPHRSTINISFYVSRGYVVFVPDIVYKTGYPGESAMSSVMPGVTKLMSTGYVDPDRIGVQGHSWGGYQIAYMVTRTNLFTAAEAGAPVANMVSAYGGIRWGSGMSRMFQYEKTQSRIGGTLWEYPNRYLTNSPIFRVDDIETPLLIMHNDQDAAVPWYQGIELFVALRRLGKPAWMINYNGEPHWPTKYQNKRDWTIRMQQFFDHYLMDAPAPVWMADGIPATEKGKTLGLDLRN